MIIAAAAAAGAAAGADAYTAAAVSFRVSFKNCQGHAWIHKDIKYHDQASGTTNTSNRRYVVLKILPEYSARSNLRQRRI